MPKRYTGGVSDLSSSDPAAPFSVLDPSKYDVYVQNHWGGMDLTTMTGAATGYAGAWFYSGVANWVASVEQDAGVNGANLSMTGGANDNAGGLLQDVSYMAMTTGKKFFIESRFELTAATMSDTEVLIGLSTLCAANGLANVIAADGASITMDDAALFYSLDGSADLIFTCREADSSNTVTVISTMVTATWYKVSAYYDGTDWTLYVDDAKVGVLSPNEVPVTPVVPTFFYRAGAAAAQTLKIDYLHILSEK